MSDDRRDIESELLDWMSESSWQRDDTRFDELARRLFQFQFRHCDAYQRYCTARGVTPESVESFKQIPAVPTGAFKELPLRCFGEADTVRIFRTSGTSLDRRGELHLDTLELYEASLLPPIERFVFPDLRPGERMTIRVLAPSPQEVADSSLSHMFGSALAVYGGEGSGFDVRRDELDGESLVEACTRSIERDEPLALCGTAFAFVHWLDELQAGELRFSLPRGSRIMETGGFKGRAREVARPDLYRELTDRLGVPDHHIVNQYGMTELGSQFYDSVLREPDAPRRKIAPPWTRVRIVDPIRETEAAPGELGMIVIHDLANTGSVSAVGTADLGRRATEAEGFEVVGRAPDAEARGCSIAADEMLGSAAER